MEKRIAEKVVEAFIDAHVKWHTRRRIREGCDCNFCIEKRAGTRYIGYTPFPFVSFKEEIGRLRQVPCHSLDTAEIAKDIVYRERQRKKKIVRERLNEIKREIL